MEDIFQRLKFRFRIPDDDRTVLLICLGIALVFWFFVKLSQTYSTEREVRLEYRLPVGKDFTTPPPSKLTATLHGTGWDLVKSYLFSPNPVVVFDMEENPAPEVQRSELINKIKEVVSVEIADLTRNYISLAMELTHTKLVPVLLAGEIDFAPDFFPTQPVRLIPDSVIISGPDALLESTTSISTKPIRLNAVKTGLRQSIPLQIPAGIPLKVSQQQVELLITVEQFTGKTMTVPVSIAPGPDSIRIFPTQVQLTCIVGLSHYDSISNTDFVVEADFGHLPPKPNVNTAPLVLKSQPEWVRSVSFSPKAVEFFFVQ